MSQILIDELTNDPLEIGYQATEQAAVLDENGDPVVDGEGNPVTETVFTMTPDAVADSLNDATQRTRYQVVTSAELLAWSGQGANDGSSTPSRYERIEAAAANHASLSVKGVAKAAVSLINRDGTALDFNLPDRVNMVAALVAGGVITQDEANGLFALAEVPISRAAELGLGKVKPGHVIMARQAIEAAA